MQLYYELTGVLVQPGATPTYLAANGDQLTPLMVTTLFGAGGIANSSPNASEVGHYLEPKNNQLWSFYQNLGGNSGPTYALLGVPVPGPPGTEIKPVIGATVNPWHYRSTNPVHNTRVPLICGWITRPAARRTALVIGARTPKPFSAS